MKITEQVALEIASHEAIVRQAYKDSVGVWTWSAGVTSASGHNVERYIGKPQPMKRCLEIYIWLLREKYAPAVWKAFDGYELTEAQFAAALSFHWNTGGINRASWVKHFKAGDMAKAQKAFMAWNKPKEIIGRRTAERDLFFKGKWTNKGTVAEYIRLTKKNTPVWASRVEVDIRPEIQALLGERTATPEPKPAPTPTEPAKGPLAAFFAALFGAFTRKAS